MIECNSYTLIEVSRTSNSVLYTIPVEWSIQYVHTKSNDMISNHPRCPSVDVT